MSLSSVGLLSVCGVHPAALCWKLLPIYPQLLLLSGKDLSVSSTVLYNNQQTKNMLSTIANHAHLEMTQSRL